MNLARRILSVLVGAAAVGCLAATSSAGAAAPAGTTTIAKRSGSCGGSAIATPVKYSYGKGSCSIWGFPGLKVTYRWTAKDQYAAMQAYGIDAGGADRWYNCGSGGGACTVPWGNHIATPKIRVWDAVRASPVYFTVR